MAAVPSGTITFLFTDIEGSTRLWEEQPAAMQHALVRHDRILRDAIEGHDGYVFATGGDSFAAAFQQTTEGLLAAVEAQVALEEEAWDDTTIRVRMALHAGEAEERDGDYFGPTLNRTARLMSTGHGGQVLVSQAAYEIGKEKAPEGVTFDDLGDHRLKDLDRAERIYQVRHPALPSEFAALLTLEYRPNNLPVQLTSFVGREDDLMAVLEAVNSARMLTLTGVGGSGKTRVALQTAAELLPEYPGGVWLVELADVVDPDLVLATIAAVLGVGEKPGRQLIESVAASIDDKRLLLLLDNCEHLIDTASEASAGLLERCANLQILATSRELLGVPGEAPYPLQSLALPPSNGNGEIERFDSVALFAARAATAKPGFQVTPSNAGAVVQICRRLDGMPLALELAAARMRAMTPEQIATRLDDRFALLTGGARTALPRQRTLQATIEWSYHLLDENEQAVLQSLSVFAGGFSPEIAERVAATSEITGFAVTDLVHRLVDKSLVVLGETPDGAIRYRLLETIRQFAAGELLEAGCADEARRRHAAAFAALIAEHEATLATDVTSVERLTLELDNIRAALRWSIDAGEIEQVSAITPAMSRYLAHRGRFAEGLEWVDEALRIIPDGDSESRATHLRMAGWMRHMGGDYAGARELDLQSLDMSRRLGDDHGRMAALNSLAVIDDHTGDYESEREHLEEGFALVPEDDHRLRALFTANLGWAAWKSDDMETAGRNFRSAIEIVESEGLGSPIDDYLLGLSWVVWVEGDFAEAEELARQAIASADRWGAEGDIAGYQFALATYAHDGGNDAAVAPALQSAWPVLLESREDHWVNQWLWAAARVQPEATTTVRVLGTQAALAGRSGFMFGIPIRRDRDHLVERLRDELGRTEFDRAWAEGQAATVDQAGAWALEGLDRLEEAMEF